MSQSNVPINSSTNISQVMQTDGASNYWPSVTPVDASKNPIAIALDGTDSSDSNATQATGGVGLRGWLSTLVSLFRAGTAQVNGRNLTTARDTLNALPAATATLVGASGLQPLFNQTVTTTGGAQNTGQFSTDRLAAVRVEVNVTAVNTAGTLTITLETQAADGTISGNVIGTITPTTTGRTWLCVGRGLTGNGVTGVTNQTAVLGASCRVVATVSGASASYALQIGVLGVQA